jgi:hypothetical protein
VPALERDEPGAGRREDLGDQRVVVRMQLEQRLREEEQRRVAGKPSDRGRPRGRAGPGVTRAEPGQPHEPFAVVRLRALGLHRARREHRVDRREPARDRVSPAGELARREPERRERERRRVHAELRKDDDIRRVRLDLRRDRRGQFGAVLDEPVGPRAQTLGERIAAAAEEVDGDLEALARKPGDPRLEIPAGRSVAEERRDEATRRRSPGGFAAAPDGTCPARKVAATRSPYAACSARSSSPW